MSGTEALERALDGAVERAMSDLPAAVLFSGGLDSGVLAALAKRHGPAALYTVGVDGCHDLRAGEEAAAALDLPWTSLVLTSEEVISACRETLRIAPIDNPVVLSFELPLQIIASKAVEHQLMSGQGADELFGGYDRYQRMGAAELSAAMGRDLANVLEHGAPLDQIIAGHYGKAIRHPFLDPEVRRVAADIPVLEMIREGERKVPLRSVARSMGLGALAERQKKAAQYGSGFMKVIKAEARREGLDLKDFLDALRAEQLR